MFHVDKDIAKQAGLDGYVPDLDRTKFKTSLNVQDFEYTPTVSANVEVTDEMAAAKHPLEYAYEGQRYLENPYLRMNDSCLLITNFAKHEKVDQEYVRKLIHSKDKNAKIKRIDIVEGMRGEGNNVNIKQNTAYAIVEFYMDKHLARVRRALRTTWVNESLIKVRTLKDAKNESHTDRTIIMMDIPKQAQEHDIVNFIGSQGVITNIELPNVDFLVLQKVEEKTAHAKLRQKKKDEEYRYAQQVMEDTQQIDAEFESILTDSWGEAQAKEMIKQQKDLGAKFTKVDMLDEERVQSFQRVMTSLQKEGFQVEGSKFTLGVLMKDLKEAQENVPAPTIHSGVNTEATAHHESIKANEERIKGTLSYLMTNKEQLEDTQLQFLERFVKEDSNSGPGHASIGEIDPIQKLQRMTLTELTIAYDQLNALLKTREKLITKRIKKSIEHFGPEERILWESKTWNKEQESMQDVFKNILVMNEDCIEKYLGINEQIDGINHFKNVPHEARLYQWLTHQMDFNIYKNFSDDQLQYARNPDLHKQRMYVFPRNDISLSELQQVGRAPQPFKQKYYDRIQEHIKKARQNLQVPFDEIYHRERKLVGDIVRAQKRIKEIEARQLNPAEHYKLNGHDIEPHPVLGDIYEKEGETQYIRDKRAKDRAEKLNTSRELNYQNSEYEYKEIEQLTVQDLISAGMVSRDDFEMAKLRNIENRRLNLGYALVTFSHADEAYRAANFIPDQSMYIDDKIVSILAKGRLDHSELDKSYFMKKLENDAQVVDQKQDLREARERLADFEVNMEKDLPALTKLKEFRAIAQELIENPVGGSRRHRSLRRTKREQEELYEKMKAYEKENPGVNLTTLYETEKIEKARIAQHKKAFRTYKKFEFLKAGIDQPQKTAISQKKPEHYEPFNYPGLQDVVATLLVDGFQGRVALKGSNSGRESSTRVRRGRRFDRYTEQEFLESYLGKDYAAAVDPDDFEDNFIFNESKTTKELFPDKDSYLKYPELLEDQQRIKKFMGMWRRDGEALDPEFQQFILRTNVADFFQKIDQDIEHPLDKSRSYLKDLKEGVVRIHQDSMERGNNGTYEADEMKSLYLKINEEYNINFKADLGTESLFMRHELLTARLEDLDEDADRQGKAYDKAVGQLKSSINKKMGEIKKTMNQQEREARAQELKKAAEKAATHEDFSSRVAEAWKEVDAAGRTNEQDMIPEAELGDEDVAESPSVDDEFEEGAMFRPIPRRHFQKPAGGAHKPPSDEGYDIDLEEEMYAVNGDFGGKDRARQMNENMYNFENYEKSGIIDMSSPEMKDYQDRIDDINRQRRAMFSAEKEKQMRRPEESRIPYYLTEDQEAKPYTKADLLKFRQLRDAKNKRLGIAPTKWEAVTDDNLTEVLQRSFSDVLKHEPELAIKDLTISEYLHKFKGQADFNHIFTDAGDGVMENYQKAYMDDYDIAMSDFREEDQSRSRTLEQFNTEEADIYDEYRNKAAIDQDKNEFERLQAEAVEEQHKYAQLREVYQEARDNLVETPNLHEYLDQESRGLDHLGNNTQADEDKENQEKLESILRAEEEEANYRKELLARMYGNKLTPRQYAVLTNQPEHDEKEREDFKKLHRFKTVQKAKTGIRLAEEIIDGYRRKMVSEGHWPEEQSRELLQEFIDELVEKYPNKKAYDIAIRDEKKAKATAKGLESLEFIQQREYYFDERLGQSLNEHTAELKEKFGENIRIQTRRDRDGLPIVKLSVEQKFKYNLDEILAQDPEELKRITYETQEIMLQEFMPSDPKEFLQALNSEGSGSDYLNVKGHQLLKQLTNERLYGKYKNDVDGFTAQLRMIKKHCVGIGAPAMVNSSFNGDPLTKQGQDFLQQAAMNELLEDQDLFAREIAYQLKCKKNDTYNYKHLKRSDLLKPARSEDMVFRDQVETLEETTKILEQDNKWLLEAGDKKINQDNEKFDFEAYKQLKAQIRQKKAAKERVLRQGFPEFKSYTRV